MIHLKSPVLPNTIWEDKVKRSFSLLPPTPFSKPEWLWRTLFVFLWGTVCATVSEKRGSLCSHFSSGKQSGRGRLKTLHRPMPCFQGPPKRMVFPDSRRMLHLAWPI